jgi:hypothetical protein
MSTFITRTTEGPSQIEVLPIICGHSGHSDDNPKSTRVIWPNFVQSFEAMTPNSSSDQRTWKTFHHYRRAVNLTSGVLTKLSANRHVDLYPHDYDYVQSTYPYAGFCGEFGSAAEHSVDLPSWYDPTMEFGFVPDPSGLTDLKQRSLNTMMPYVKSELSLVNSVLELKDFKSLPKTIGNIWKFAKKLPSTWKQGSKTLRSLTRTTADGYLQAEFNILPLLSDIAGVRTAISKTRANINRLVSGQGQRQRRHYRCPLTVKTPLIESRTYSSPPKPFGSYPWGADLMLSCSSYATRYVYTDVAIFHAEIEYNYNFTQYQTEHAQLLGFLDALGVNLNPAIIWNAIPWSFVVDWVLGVSSWLSSRKLLNMEPVVNIHNYLWSVTYRRRILVSRKITRSTRDIDLGPSITVTDPEVSLPVVTESAYRRQVEMPSAGSIVSSGLSLKEFSLGAALVLARGKH